MTALALARWLPEDTQNALAVKPKGEKSPPPKLSQRRQQMQNKLLPARGWQTGFEALEDPLLEVWRR